ncbi:MAG: saccharopine dehydrogenase C-terminal domain-containing protein [Acidobacteriota bacterium]
MKIIILGAGLVGGPIAADLSKDKDFSITVADIDKDSLENLKNKYDIKVIKKDLSYSDSVRALVKKYDLVVNAVPGFMGFKTVKAVIEAGKDIVDIAFFPEDPFLLDELARKNNVTAIVDCGVAPGMSNIFTGFHEAEMDSLSSVIIYVGGLPEERKLPFEYKAVFSPVDVIEEYIRPARLVEDGKIVIKPALTEPEYINFEGVGTLEAFNSDGLRTLATTIKAKNMKEKTLRYPGHIEKISFLKELGFFNSDKVNINGTEIAPIDLTTKLLLPEWKFNPGDTDITVMRVIIEGLKDKKKYRYTYDMFDKYEKKSGIHSMARTTGYTATMVTRLLSKGLYKKKGISPPEFVGREPGTIDFIIKGLEERGIKFLKKEEKI